MRQRRCYAFPGWFTQRRIHLGTLKNHRTLVWRCTLALLATASTASAQESDIPSAFVKPDAQNDYLKRVELVPMRDGVKLYTVIVIPKGVNGAPIILTRTPYDAKERVSNDNPAMTSLLPETDIDFAQAGYIRVFQDVRGKHGSEGVFEMTRPPRGPLNHTATDETTDAWDTIDWLVKNIPQCNGRVGMFGFSYEGFTVVMALLEPHPASRPPFPRARWWTAGWATTGSTTGPSGSQPSITSRSRPSSAARARRSRAPRAMIMRCS